MYPYLDRIIEMEARLKRLIAVLESNPTLDELILAQADAIPLTEYMQGEWIEDYEADEQGLIPKDLHRGVLSQDLLYDAVCDNDRILRELLSRKTASLTNGEIIAAAKAQSAIDLSCNPEDFSGENRIVISKPNDRAHRYLKLPFDLNLVSYGDNVVASCSEAAAPIALDYINSYPIEHLFETPNLNVLAERLSPLGLKPCFMAEYFLPDTAKILPKPIPYKTKLLTRLDFEDLYLPEWSNALCKQRKHLDILGIGAYDGKKLIGLAACSADCEAMWQIGIDVLPEYRRQGIAQHLTSSLALEILSRGKVPYYCAAWSNIKSVRNAIACGFKPAWVEHTAKPAEAVDKMNNIFSLETERLAFRKWHPSDAERLFALASDPKVGPACGWLPHKSVEESAETVKNILSGEHCYALVLKETDEIVGCIDCFKNGDGNREIGYWLGSEYWGRGLMPEAVKELLRFCFEELGYTEVWCGHFEQNHRSKGVIEKCGFTLSHIEPEKYQEALDENVTVYMYLIKK